MPIGVATSTKSNSRSAAQDAADRALSKAGGASFGFVFFSAKRDAEEVASGAEDSFQEHPFMGHSTFFQVTPEGFFTDSVSVMAIQAPATHLGVGIGRDVQKDPRTAGRTAIIEALKHLRVGSYPTPFATLPEVVGMMRFNPLTCMMFTSRPYEMSGIAEEEILQGILDVTGTKFEIVGSSCAGVDPITKTPIQPLHVIANGKSYINAVVCGAIASNQRIGLAMGHGFTPTSKIALVNRASGNVVYEMNGKLALKAFAELTGLSEDEVRTYFAVAPFLRKGKLNHCAFGLMDPRGEYWLKIPRYALDNDALFFTTQVKPGSVMTLMETDEKRVLGSISEVAKKTVGNAATTDMAGALGFNCSSHRLVVDDLSKEYDLLKSVWGSTPFLVVSSGGEQGPTASGITWHTNMACVGVGFSNIPLVETEKLTADYVEHYVHEGTRAERTMAVAAQVRPVRADIQANLIVYNRHAKVGEEIEVEIEIVNAGTAPGKLVKIENLISSRLTLKRHPADCALEGEVLNLKGRIVSPMRTEEIKLVVAPTQRGEIQLKPRILYLDEAGKYRSHEPEAIPIIVRELGISGWLKGPVK